MNAGELKMLLRDVPDDVEVKFDSALSGRTWPFDSFIGKYNVSRGALFEGWADEAGRKYLESKGYQPKHKFEELDQPVFVLTDFRVPK